MKQERQGSFKGLAIIIKNSTVSVAAVFSFSDGTIRVPISEKNADNFISSFNTKYGIGVANKNVFLKYVDYDMPLAFVTEIWSEESNRLELIINNLKGSKMVEKAMRGVNPDVNIVNYGITLDMNTLVKIGTIPDELKTFKCKENFSIPEDIKDVFLNLTVTPSCVSSYFNDYGNEGWNGPQCYGGVTISGMINKNEADYDFELGRFLNKKEYNWNDNTTVSFSKSGYYEILCLLSDIAFFKPLGKDNLYSAIDEDIRMLCDLNI